MDDSYNLEYTLYYSSISFLVTGFIGYVLVILIVHKSREMHTPRNYVLVSIAISDIFTFCCGIWTSPLNSKKLSAS